MSHSFLFIKGPNPDSEEIMMFVNIDRICASRGREPTEQYPMGSQTEILFGGAQFTFDLPFVKWVEEINKKTKIDLEFSAQWQEISRQLQNETYGKTMREVLRDFNDNHR